MDMGQRWIKISIVKEIPIEKMRDLDSTEWQTGFVHSAVTLRWCTCPIVRFQSLPSRRTRSTRLKDIFARFISFMFGRSFNLVRAEISFYKKFLFWKLTCFEFNRLFVFLHHVTISFDVPERVSTLSLVLLTRLTECKNVQIWTMERLQKRHEQ